ncbi:hypothetical protein JSY14_00365 [Brachybacterium sp. EF45031]|uniref:PH-like domain-containing protein n=1 Tax=Brachybacterium sillae TaxID=2810536 RepID=UPI00217CF01D|nr:hypothetical protein [Brachybacterium sillae]MCS6710546.1 hypothetical protein [Brachybacterium sillae]
MGRTDAVLLLILLFAALVGLMALGWHARGRSQAFLPPPAPDEDLTEVAGGVAVGPFPGVYVSTVLAGQPFERVVAHGLGSRSPVVVTRGVDGSWRLQRTGAPSFTIPGDRVQQVGTAPGMAGKVVGGDGLLVIRWTHGPDDTALDTGLRLDDPAHRALLVDTSDRHDPTVPTAPAPGATTRPLPPKETA